MRFKTKIRSHLGEKKNRGKRGEGEKREEEEEEKKSKQSQAPKRYGTNLDYGFYEIWHGSLGLYDD